MAFLRDLSIRKKLVLFFGSVCLLAVGIGVISLFILARVSQASVEINDKWLPGVRTLDAMHSQHSREQRALLDHSLCTTPACSQSYESMYREAKEKLHKGFREFQSLITTKQEKELLAYLDGLVGTYEDDCERILVLPADTPKDEHYQQLLDKARKSYQAAYDVGDQVVDTYNRGAGEATSRAIATTSTARVVEISAILFALVVAGIAIVMLTNLIAKPVSEASLILKRLSEKNLVQTFDFHSGDEVGEMAVSLNTTIRTMREIFSRLAANAKDLARSTESIASTSEQSAERSRNQSAQMQQSASATHEMASTIAEISENTEKAAHASMDSAEKASVGGDLVSDAMVQFDSLATQSANAAAAMHSLRTQSDEIGKVVGVIREIADQTNLLALNAAIESARAGEHGRGFAVVAGEVRRLAERTRESTEEITRMVDQIQTRTHEAVESSSASNAQLQQALDKVKLVGDALSAIVQGARRSEELVTLIASATTEQRAAALEVSQGLADLANGAAADMIAAETSSKSCGTLAGLATELEQMVDEFQFAA